MSKFVTFEINTFYFIIINQLYVGLHSTVLNGNRSLSN